MTEKNNSFKLQLRVVLTAVIFIIQILLMVVAVNLFHHDVIWFYTFLELIAMFTVIYITNKRGNPSYKIPWIIFILIFPVFGILVYTFWGGQRTLPHQKKKMNICKKHFMPYLNGSSEAEERLIYESNSILRQSNFLANESGFPVYSNTDIEYLSPGEIFYPRFLCELEKAQKYIFIEFFIIAEGKMWNGIKDILFEKAKQGIEVKIIFDDFGSLKRQKKSFCKELNANGIQTAVFNPIKPPFNAFMNNRNHRKLVVIDGNTAFTGGINIGDEYINEYERFGYWMDSAVLIRGKAVDSFTVMFAVMWEYITDEQIPVKEHLLSFPSDNTSFVQPYSDDPMDFRFPAQGIYTQILNTAHRYVYIATPYLILDSNMSSALIMAAKSGVDIRILTPHIPDKKYVHPATQFHYTELLEAGIRIFEYKPGFIHSKIFVSDDSVATVGSVNMDFRSFLLHFECGVWFTDKTAVSEIKAQFNAITHESKEILLTEWKKRSVFARIKEWFLHLFAPLM